MSRIDFYLLSPGLRSSDFAGVLCTVVQTMCVVVINDDPWLDYLGIAHDTASDVLVRAFGCHGYLPAQQVMGPESQDCDDLDDRHLS